ncbi:MAG: 23S rRNA (guanosine(2251)-2'-O)-methyltransferase RlmB [Gammaproteobacteria bacterium]|nr:MAG: 23S rRNA (guanosine(2251)-2'-O)-methyltransferase RlmB [Gammaproteobacteria bacterium]
MAKIEILSGFHACLALIERYPERILEVFIQQDKSSDRAAPIVALAKQHSLPVQEISRKKLDDKTEGASHQGICLRYRPQQAETENALISSLEDVSQSTLFLILDSITDPHNLGACLRSADAAGVDGVIIAKDKSVGLTPAVRKVACGAAESVPFYQVTNLARCLGYLKDAGVFVVGTALSDKAHVIYQSNFKAPTALVMGAEDKGLRRLTAELCDELVYLPMSGSVQSLNVSVATGVCLFEVVRQRQV